MNYNNLGLFESLQLGLLLSIIDGDGFGMEEHEVCLLEGEKISFDQYLSSASEKCAIAL